jgi:hypothetical protein
MARLDALLLAVFGCFVIIGLTGAVLTFRQALRVSGQKDGDIKMFMWTAGTMIFLILAGVSTAYIVLPILLHY